MEVLTGLVGIVLGAVAGGLVTYVTTRSNMRLELQHAHDQSLRDKRLAHYAKLFYISRAIPRQWSPQEEPTRQDLLRVREDFHNWYFGEEAGGLFLTPAAKDNYMLLQNMLEVIAGHHTERSLAPDSRLSTEEKDELYKRASALRHQLAEDVGASEPPTLRFTRLGGTIPPPSQARTSETNSPR